MPHGVFVEVDKILAEHDELGVMLAGSRTRYITPDSDNYGFARWVKEHASELWTLGFGRHFGEWWGQGIQRGYGLKEKRFSLFNVGRWNDDNKPPCCSTVPVLYRGPFDTETVQIVVDSLAVNGSYAAPSFMDPEGVIVFHEALGSAFKKTIRGDESPKTLTQEGITHV